MLKMVEMSDVHTEEHAVVIAGGGPTGLMLAAELALAEIDVVVVERRPDQVVDGSRAGGLYPRTIEVLDQRGVAERFIEAGYVVPALGFGGITLDISDFPTRHNYVLALWQSEFEPILAAWAEELGVPILREREVVGLTQLADGVDVAISDGTALRAAYLVGCDGGHSVVRKAAGIEFPGLDASTSWLIAQVDMDEEPEIGMRPEGGGIGPVNRQSGGNPYGVVLTELSPNPTDELTLGYVGDTLRRVYETDFGLRSARWISRFSDMTRQAASYRADRVLLAGDAAHVHPPHGGQGLNTGVQDAVNLGWKLARVVAGTSPESLLDTYHAERHPVAARVLQNTKAQVALSTPGERHQALRDSMRELLGMDEPRRRTAGMLAALDIRYDIGDGHPMIGRRMPDLDLLTPDGPTRVFSLMHGARALLLNLSGERRADLDALPDRVSVVDAEHRGAWDLPVIGPVDPPAAVLIRPDGHVAWAGDLADPTLDVALETWFGAAGPAADHCVR